MTLWKKQENKVTVIFIGASKNVNWFNFGVQLSAIYFYQNKSWYLLKCFLMLFFLTQQQTIQ